MTDEDDGIICDACILWIHSICQGVSEAEMRMLNCHRSRPWICSGCKEDLKKYKLKSECCSQLESRIQHIEGILTEQTKLLNKLSKGQDLTGTMKENHKKVK